jgi:hypothetical protein
MTDPSTIPSRENTAGRWVTVILAAAVGARRSLLWSDLHANYSGPWIVPQSNAAPAESEPASVGSGDGLGEEQRHDHAQHRQHAYTKRGITTALLPPAISVMLISKEIAAKAQYMSPRFFGPNGWSGARSSDVGARPVLRSTISRGRP